MLHVHEKHQLFEWNPPFFLFSIIDGFLFVEELLAHPQFRAYSVEDVERVVATNDKQRYKLRRHPEDGRLQIRASQGHSIQVNGVEKPQMVQ